MSLARYAPALDAVRGIDWPALRRVRTVPAGPHPAVVRGSTAEFLEYRPYRQGDDPRRIDWKLVARSDRTYVRVSQERTLLPTLLVADASASMAFPAPLLGKWEHARQLAVALAAVARDRGDPVGLRLAAADAVRTVPPSTRRTVLARMMSALELTPAGGGGFLAAAEEALRSAARIVLLTDFLDDEDALLAAVRTAAAAGREVYGVHVVAGAELDPDPRQRLVEDPERPGLRRPLPPGARAQYLDRFREWRERLARRLRNAGAVYTLVVPETEPFRRTVRRITAAGARGGGQAA